MDLWNASIYAFWSGLFFPVTSCLIPYTFNVLTNLPDVYCEPPSLLVVRRKKRRNDTIWKPFQYCHFQCPDSLICTTLGTECVCQPFSCITVQDTKQIAPPIMATPDIGYILLPKLVWSFRYSKDPLYDNMPSDTSFPDKISKLHDTVHLLSVCCYPTSMEHGCYSPDSIGWIFQCHFFYGFKDCSAAESVRRFLLNNLVVWVCSNRNFWNILTEQTLSVRYSLPHQQLLKGSFSHSLVRPFFKGSFASARSATISLSLLFSCSSCFSLSDASAPDKPLVPA